MKKTLLIVSLLLVSLIAHSQARLGIRAGANIADISEIGTDKKIDFYGGLVLNIKVSEKYTLTPELIYSKQGAKFDVEEANLLGNSNTIEMEYFSIGIINKFYASKNINFQFGPTIDIRVYENFETDIDFIIFPHLDISFTGGFGFDVSPNLSLEARYKQGLVDVLDNNDLFGYETEDFTQETRNLNQVFQLGITYTFDFK